MNKLFLVAAFGAMLSGCVSHNFREGERVAWRCEGGQDFSLRRVAGNVEVFAAGQTHTLAPAGERNYSNGAVSYTIESGGASLTGASGGPYENCRRTGVLPRVW